MLDRRRIGLSLFLCGTLLLCTASYFPVKGEMVGPYDNLTMLRELKVENILLGDNKDKADKGGQKGCGANVIQGSENQEKDNDKDRDEDKDKSKADHGMCEGLKPFQITVKSGDTLWDLARYFGTTVDQLVKLNNLSNPNILKVGQKLWIYPGFGQSKELKTNKMMYYSEDARNIGKMSITKEEYELLARVIHAEARGESFEGKVAVGAVVLNRVNSPGFPNTIKEVIYQPGAFTAVDDKQIHLTPSEEAYRAALAALNGYDPTDGALFYYNPKIATDRWIKGRPVIKTIGNHTFSI